MKKIFSKLLVLVLIISLFVPLQYVKADIVKLNKTSISIQIGSNYTLKITGNNKATWESSDKTIATVSPKGLVTGKKIGKTKITATANKKKYSCSVTVTPIKYTEGQYKIGADMPNGEYVIFSDNSESGYFSLTSDANGDNIIANENFDYNSIITVNKGEYLELSRSYAVNINDISKLDTSKSGMYKIGTFLPAGEYKLIANSGEEGYYCIYSDNRQENIVTNDNFKNSSYVTVENGQYLLLSRCTIDK